MCAYLHSGVRRNALAPAGDCCAAQGLGFGGSINHPRLFVPESLEGCTAGFLDNTYKAGNLAPDDALEKFDISVIEIWAVNGDIAVKEALEEQAKYRNRNQAFLESARVVRDKYQFARDFETGLVPSSLFEHKAHVRGRHEFRVDDSHGGYTIDRE